MQKDATKRDHINLESHLFIVGLGTNIPPEEATEYLLPRYSFVLIARNRTSNKPILLQLQKCKYLSTSVWIKPNQISRDVLRGAHCLSVSRWRF